jgi:hypothetical protein
MHRDDADGAAAEEGRGGHGCAGERRRRLAPVPSVPRKGRAATRVQPLRGAGAGADDVIASPWRREPSCATSRENPLGAGALATGPGGSRLPIRVGP